MESQLRPDDETAEHSKETYAYFGLAFHAANVFEAGLAIAVLQLDFLTQTIDRLKREGRSSFDKAVYEAEFDTFMASQHALSLGNLIKRALSVAEIPAPPKDKIAEVKRRRDFLAHHFFRERDIEFLTRQGRDGMIAELEAARDLFAEADRALDDFMAPHRRRLGMTDEALAAQYAELLRTNGITPDLSD